MAPGHSVEAFSGAAASGADPLVPGEAVLGVDTHGEVHVAAVVAPLGRGCGYRVLSGHGVRLPSAAREAGPARRAGCPAGRAQWRRPGSAGASPLTYSWSHGTLRRLDQGGERRPNATPHRIVITWLCFDPRTPAYDELRHAARLARLGHMS